MNEEKNTRFEEQTNSGAPAQEDTFPSCQGESFKSPPKEERTAGETADRNYNNFSGEENSGNSNNAAYDNPGVYSAPKSYVTFIPYGYTPKTYEERRGLKKAAVTIGISLLLLLGISIFWATAYFFIMGRLGFTYERALAIVSDPAVMQLVQVVLSVFMFTVPFIIVYKINSLRISDLVPLGKPKKGNRLAMFFIGLSFCAFANIASSYAGYFFQSFGIDYNVDYGENPGGIFGFLLAFLSTSVVPGLIEEFACRGLIMGLLRKYGDGFAVLASAILFGLLHGNFDQMPFAFMVGLVLGFIVVQTNSLWIAVAVHAANNFVSVAFTYLLGGLSAEIQNLVYSLYLMAALTLGIAAAAVTSRGTEIFKFRESGVESAFSQRCKWFFTSPVIIIFIVVCILESLIYFA